MSESKELLEATIKGLEEKVNELNNDLHSKQKELEDINKPEMTAEMYDQIQGLIEDSINQVSISDNDVEYSVEVDYDKRINMYDISLNDTYNFTSSIMQEIDNHYKIVDKSE